MPEIKNIHEGVAREKLPRIVAAGRGAQTHVAHEAYPTTACGRSWHWEIGRSGDLSEGGSTVEASCSYCRTYEAGYVLSAKQTAAILGEKSKPSAPLKTTVTVYANGAGLWRARIDFDESMSESGDSRRHHLLANWARLRRQARAAIVKELALREMRAGEGWEAAQRRVSRALPPLSVIDSKLDSMNRGHSVTFGE